MAALADFINLTTAVLNLFVGLLALAVAILSVRWVARKSRRGPRS